MYNIRISSEIVSTGGMKFTLQECIHHPEAQSLILSPSEAEILAAFLLQMLEKYGSESVDDEKAS